MYGCAEGEKVGHCKVQRAGHGMRQRVKVWAGQGHNAECWLEEGEEDKGQASV